MGENSKRETLHLKNLSNSRSVNLSLVFYLRTRGTTMVSLETRFAFVGPPCPGHILEFLPSPQHRGTWAVTQQYLGRTHSTLYWTTRLNDDVAVPGRGGINTALGPPLRGTWAVKSWLTVRLQIPQARTPGRERLCIRISITFLATSEMAEPSMSRKNLGISPEPPDLSQFCLPTTVRAKKT